MFIGLIIISVVFGGIGALVSRRLRSKFAQYSQMPLSKGLNGAEVAKAMLQHYSIHDVQIVEGRGMLTDHYNPQKKLISLSPDVYHGRTVAAAAVAAHECGHAVQHAESYAALKFRSAMVPLVNISSSMQQYLFMGAMFMGAAGNSSWLLIGAIAIYGITALFSTVTLPVEFDASNRALAWLDSSGFARGSEYDGAKDALWWAAMTYTVGAIAAIAQLLWLVFIFMGSRD